MEDGTTLRGTSEDIDLAHLYLKWDLACEKFRQLTEPHLGQRRADEIIDLVGRMDTLDSVTPITQRMTPAPRNKTTQKTTARKAAKK